VGSAFLPLHEGLIVTSNGEEVAVISAESNADDVLGVTSVASGLTLDDGVAEQVHETVIISGSHELAVSRAANRVDVSSIGSGGVDTLGLPLELAGLGFPLGTLGVGTARWVLSAVWDGEEQKLVSTTVGADVRAILAPVKSHDVGGVSLALANK
jgi:hypothetical protein